MMQKGISRSFVRSFRAQSAPGLRSIRSSCVVVRAESVKKEELLKVAKAAAEAGAAQIHEALDKPSVVQFKGATDLVTETDTASEEAVLAVIRRAFPDHAILGEEGGVSGNLTSEYLWCVDPLDGTTNFSHRYPSFAVSVGVLKNGSPVASCVVEFTGGPGAWATRTFTASRNQGAFLNGTKQLQVSRTNDITRALLVTGFGYEHDDCWAANLELFKHFTDKTQGVRRLGAASVDLCHVALGLVDGYWEYCLKPWDMAAGALIVEEAGGLVTTTDGLQFSAFDKSILATNGLVHAAVQAKTEATTSQLLEDGYDLKPWFVPKGYRVKTGRRD